MDEKKVFRALILCALGHQDPDSMSVLWDALAKMDEEDNPAETETPSADEPASTDETENMPLVDGDAATDEGEGEDLDAD